LVSQASGDDQILGAEVTQESGPFRVLGALMSALIDCGCDATN
jgi:hypothetical protein